MARARTRRWGLAGARLATVLAALLALPADPARADETLWAALRAGGYVIMIRHAATEPGTGDPPGFRLDDCATQRNLSSAGRAEARRVGEAFRRHGVPVSRVLSSEWCRCRDTARLAFGGYEPWPMLNSLFEEPERGAERTRAVHELGRRVRPGENLVLVTHNFNIRAVAGVSPVSAELVVLRPAGGGQIELVGRITVPP